MHIDSTTISAGWICSTASSSLRYLGTRSAGRCVCSMTALRALNRDRCVTFA
jgi:hypothetical protein